MVLSVCGDKQGRAGQGRAGQPRQTPAHWTCWLYIRSLGKTRGLASNQTKIQFKKNYFHYRTYLKTIK